MYKKFILILSLGLQCLVKSDVLIDARCKESDVQCLVDSANKISSQVFANDIKIEGLPEFNPFVFPQLNFQCKNVQFNLTNLKSYNTDFLFTSVRIIPQDNVFSLDGTIELSSVISDFSIDLLIRGQTITAKGIALIVLDGLRVIYNSSYASTSPYYKLNGGNAHSSITVKNLSMSLAAIVCEECTDADKLQLQKNFYECLDNFLLQCGQNFVIIATSVANTLFATIPATELFLPDN